MIMGSVEPEECSALFSARSSEQSSLGLIRLDSVAGLSGCLLEDDSLPSARPGSLSPVKEAPASGDTADPRTPTSPDGYSPGMASCYEEVSEGDCTDGSDTESVPGADGGVDPRYLRCLTVAHDWEGAAAGSPPDSLPLEATGLETPSAFSPDGPRHSVPPAADPADISGQQISARSTSIGAACSPDSRDFQDDTGQGFGSGCFDGLEDFQKEFHAGGFFDGGEAFKAELAQAEQSLDRNGLPLVNFSLSSGTYDPHAKIRPSDFDESVNISQFLKAGSYPMGVLGDASSVEPPPRFSMSMAQTSWQSASGRIPDDFDSTSSTLPVRSRDTFSVSHGSGYSQIHGAAGPVRVGTYTVLTTSASAPDASCRPDAHAAAAGQTAAPPARRRGSREAAVGTEGADAELIPASGREVSHMMEKATASTESSRGFSLSRTASSEQRYASQRAVGSVSAEESRGSHVAGRSAPTERRSTYGDPKAAERGRASQDSQDASVTLVNASGPSQDSRDVTLTPERSPTGRHAGTATRPRPLPRHSAALGDSLRRKIVDVLNRTEEARLQLLVPGRQTPQTVVKATAAAAAAVTVSQRLTLTEMVSLSEQPLDDGPTEDTPAPAEGTHARPAGAWADTSAPLSDAGSALGSWLDGGEWPQAYSQVRSDELKRRQQQEMAEHKQRQEERIQAARDQQAALRKQWEAEQELKEKIARQKKIQKKRDAKARRDSLDQTKEEPKPVHDGPVSQPSSPTRRSSPRRPKPKPQESRPKSDPKPQQQPPPPPQSSQPTHKAAPTVKIADPPVSPGKEPVPSAAAAAGAPDPEAVSRILRELNAAAPASVSGGGAPAHPLTMQQVVEAVMRQLAVPAVSLDESCRSRAELDVTDILQELRGEKQQLNSQMARRAAASEPQEPGGEKQQPRRAAASEPAVASATAAVSDSDGGGTAGGKDVTRMAETVSRLHRGVPARPRGEPRGEPRRRSPLKRAASIPVKLAGARRGPDSARPAVAAARRRPATTSERPGSAPTELSVRGRRVPRMGVRRHVEEHTADESDRTTASSRRGSPPKPGRKSPARTSAAAAIAATAAAAARAAAVSSAPDTARSDSSTRTYSIASDRAPGSLPAVVAEHAPQAGHEPPVTAADRAARAAPPRLANPESRGVSMDYDSPEFLVALAARRYPSSTPSLARSINAFVASESLDHVSPIIPADSDASEPSKEAAGAERDEQDVDSGADSGAESRSEAGGDVMKSADVSSDEETDSATAASGEGEGEERVNVLVPPPAVWRSEDSAVALPTLELRHLTGTSTGSMTTAPSTAARASSAAVSLTEATSLQTRRQQQQQAVPAAGSSSAEAAAGAPRPRRSRIPTPVRRHVSDLATATGCQSAPCLLQGGGESLPPLPAPPVPAPAPLPSAVPAAAVGRRPGTALSGGDRPAGPRPVLRANSAGTCDSAAQTGRTAAATAVQRHARLARSASERTATRPPTTAPATSRVSTQIQTSATSVTAEKERNVETTAEGGTKTVSQTDKVPTDSTVARTRTNSVSTGVQTSDRTFTKPADKPPASAKSVTASPDQPEPTADDAPALVTAEAQTETDQSWTEPTAKQRAERRTTVERVPSHRGDSAADGPPPPRETKPDAPAVPHATHPPLPAPAERPDEPENSHVPAAAPEEEAAGSDGCLLVHTPAHVTHPDVLCTDIPAEVSVPVLNRTEHWLQLVPRVATVELNGAALPLRDAAAVCTVSLRTRTLLDGHQEAAVRVSVTPRAAGRIAVTLLLAVEPIERRLSGLAAPDRSCRVELRLAAERPAVEVLSQEPGVLDFGTLPEDCRKVVPLTLVNLSRAAVPVTLSVLSAGRAFHLPDGDPPSEPGVAAGAAAPTRLTSTLAQFTLPPADASRQGISPVTLNVALLTPCLDAADTDCPPPLSLHGSLEVQLDGACPAPSEPLLSCRLTATVGRVKLRTRSREPLELRCRPAQTTSVNLPMRNAGNIPLELRLSVTGLRDSVWVRPEHVTVPARGERDVMLTFQPRDRHSGGRGLLVLTVQPDGAAYEVDIVGVIGDCREVERTRPSSPEMKSARRHTQARKQRRGSPRRHHSSGGSRSRSRSGSPGRAPPTSGRSGAQHAAVTEARDTGVQTSLLALAPAGDGPAATAAALPVLRQPAEPPPQPPKSHRAAAPALHSNKRLLLWTGVRCGRPTTRSLVLRNSSETEPLALRLAIVSGPQFSFRMFDEESGGGGGGGVSGASMELRLPARSERELTLVYQPARVEATAATLVIKPVVRPRGGVGSKFTIPLIAYSGSADIQLGVSAEQGLRLGEVQPAATVHAPLTVTNAGERSAFVTVLAYRDAECRHPLTSSEFSARPCKFSLSAGEMRQVALVLRLPPAGSPPPACLRLLSGDDLLRQAFSQLPRDQPLSSRLPSPGLMAVDFGGPFEGEQEPDPAELAALRKLPSVADTFFGCLRQTRLPIRATISARAMDSSDVFTMLHADDTVASILNNTSFANVTREPRRAAVSAAAPVSSRAAPAQQSHHLSTSQRPVRLPAAAPCALRGPPVSDISVESGPVTCGAPEQLMPPPPPVCGLPPTLPPSFGGGGRPAPLQLDSDQVLFSTTAVGQRSPATLGFTNGSGVGLRWTLEALVKPWIQSTPRACDLTQVSGDVFRFHPTQGSVLPGQTLTLSARFSPPAAGYFTQTFYLVTCADAAPLDSEQPVQPSCLLVRVAGQATPAPASAVQQPERFPLTVEPDTIEFPPDQRAVKLTINNKTRVDYEFELHVSGPFSVNHERMVSRARRYIHLPVFFQPPGAGLFTGRLTLSLSQPTGSAQRCFHVTLLGEVP